MTSTIYRLDLTLDELTAVAGLCEAGIRAGGWQAIRPEVVSLRHKLEAVQPRKTKEQ